MSGGYDLSINMSDLRTLADDLGSIVDELKNADDNSEDAADATGHDELRDRVQDFADKWRIKREEMLGDVEKLQGIVKQIADTFDEVDGELARSFEEQAAKAGA